MDIKNLRLNYKKSAIDFNNFEENPIHYFVNWFSDALEVNKYEANVCVLSTISVLNRPSSRLVLLKQVNENGFIFFTNYTSSKAKDIEHNNNVTLNFYWPELERQVRISGEAGKINYKDSDAYFRSRPRASQLGTWLSNQSTSISLDHNFTESLTKLEAKFKGKEVTRPSHWGGYCIDVDKIEFWQGRPSRFHDRVLYEFDTDNWSKRRLAP
mgnify:CR=1 FL=1